MNMKQSPNNGDAAPSKRKKILTAIGAVVVLLMLIGIGINVVLNESIRPSKAYTSAEELYQNGSYAEAEAAFVALGDFKDSEARAAQCRDDLGLHYLNRRDYINLNAHIIRYGLSDAVHEQLLATALDDIEHGEYDEVRCLLSALTVALDARATITEALYQQSLIHYNGGDYEISDELFIFLDDYKDSRSLIHVHEYILTTQTAPTCTEPGLAVSVCQCGAAETSNIDPIGHDYADGSCKKAPVCKHCGQEGEPALGHTLVDCVCSKCGKVFLTIEQLQGSWLHNQGYERIIVSGDQATVISYTTGITFTGTVQFRDYGFFVEGTYEYAVGSGVLLEGHAKTTCYVSRFTDSYFIDTFDDQGPYAWHKE